MSCYLVLFVFLGVEKEFRCTIYPQLDGAADYNPGIMSWTVGDEEVQKSDNYLNVIIVCIE